jgi:hypothetical protein
MEIANVPREHWPTTTYVEQDPHATIPRWPFEVNPDALRFSALEPHLVNLESYLSVAGLEAFEFHRLSEQWVIEPGDEQVSMEAGFSIEPVQSAPNVGPLSHRSLALCIAASSGPESETLTLANFRVGQMHFHNGLFVDAIRHLYFCLEHEFANGKSGYWQTVDEFCRSTELSEIVRRLFFDSSHTVFERIRGKHDALRDGTEPRHFFKFLVSLRGSIQHANRHRPGKWHPSRQHVFECEALCIMHVAEEVCLRKVTAKLATVPVTENGNDLGV